ncbi:reverse transcriptase domain-containing protein [Tanacetum coccineum]
MYPRCSDLLQNHLPPKEQDPGSFILPCSIGRLDFKNALADLGASISIMPFSMYKRLGIRKLEPINMIIEMADNTKCTSKGIVENLLIKIDRFIFPVDFVILDMVEDIRMPIILGRPMLATAHAKRKRFGDEEDDLEENLEDLEECGEDKANTILGGIHDKLNNNWFNNTSEDEDDLEGILDYLKPRSYDGFIDLDDEAYNKRR